MADSDIRAAFERRCTQSDKAYSVRKTRGGTYTSPFTQSAWATYRAGWHDGQAALSALSANRLQADEQPADIQGDDDGAR